MHGFYKSTVCDVYLLAAVKHAVAAGAALERKNV